jgi:hypothetical protein
MSSAASRSSTKRRASRTRSVLAKTIEHQILCLGVDCLLAIALRRPPTKRATPSARDEIATTFTDRQLVTKSRCVVTYRQTNEVSIR